MSRKITMFKDCEWCKTPFSVKPSTIKAGRKCCSHKCSKAYLWSKPEYQQHMSLAHKGYIPTNLSQLKEYAQSNESRERTSNLGKKIGGWNKGLSMPQISGENHYLWKDDRTHLKDDHKDRGGQLHREWSKSVKNRDGWKCRISNSGCSGRLESHHILGWKSHPELRYQINNGITLCHFHHPRKRVEEERFSPYFKSLVMAKM